MEALLGLIVLVFLMVIAFRIMMFLATVGFWAIVVLLVLLVAASL